MREILFRGKRTDNDQWVEGYCSSMSETKWQFEEHFIMTGERESFYGSGTCIEYPKGYKVHIETCGQFTGLYDKNKKRIFEGDLLKCPSDDYDYCLIEWDSKIASFMINGYGKQMYFNEGGGEEFTNSASLIEENVYCFGEELEIIGNIHDNPELLTSK